MQVQIQILKMDEGMSALTYAEDFGYTELVELLK
jgi:hypothetical protein